MKVDLEAVLGVATQLVVLLAGLGGLYVALRRWVERAAGPAQRAADQLKTSNGTTVAGYVEKAASDLENLNGQVSTLVDRANTNRDLAMSALALARHAHERLDAHLAGHQKEDS